MKLIHQTFFLNPKKLKLSPAIMLKSVTIHVLTPYYQSIFLLYKNIKKALISYYRGNKSMKVKKTEIYLIGLSI